MGNPIIESAEAFEQLIKTDIDAWLKLFLEEGTDSSGESFNFGISDVGDWEEAELTLFGLDLCEVHSKGGTEGGGDHAEKVFGIYKGDDPIAYFKIDGFYCSHEGTEWEDHVYLVEPREVVVTKWFQI